MPVDYNMEARIAYLSWLAAEDMSEAAWVRTLRDYTNGNQPIRLTDRQKEFLGIRKPRRLIQNQPSKISLRMQELDNDSDMYAHNLCKLVIASVTERLKWKGFSPLDEEAKSTNTKVVVNTPVDTNLVSVAHQWWSMNRMDAVQDEVYEAALRDGESYLLVDWDPDTQSPRWTLNFKFDGTQGIKLHRDPSTNKVLFASKRWQTFDITQPGQNGYTRLNLYFPDRVEKYIDDKAKGVTGTINGQQLQLGWAEYRDDPAEPWPIPWIDADGRALGLAVVPFINPSGSEIEDMVGLQDMLNKSDVDLIAAADGAGFRILYAAGIDAVIDPATGQEKTLSVSPGQMMRFSNPAAKLAAVEAGGIESELAACRYFIESIAGITRTPQYLFQAQGADQPSGESLKMQETGLVHKTKRKQGVFGNAWEDVITLSAQLNNKYRSAFAVPIVRVQTEWASPERQDETEALDNALKKSNVGIPNEQIWAELGYEPQQIEEFKKSGAKLAQERLKEARLNFDRQNQSGDNTDNTSPDQTNQSQA